MLYSLDFFSSFPNPIHNPWTPWTGDQVVTRPLPTHGTTQTQNKRTQTSMPSVELEPIISVLERAKAVRASDRAATVIWHISITILQFCTLSMSCILF
jgi:hypothetical protein